MIHETFEFLFLVIVFMLSKIRHFLFPWQMQCSVLVQLALYTAHIVQLPF